MLKRAKGISKAEYVIRAPEAKVPEQKEDGLPVDIRLPVKHVLSRELQLYFDKITELTVTRSDSVLFKEALLHQLMPSVVTCLVAKKLGNRVADNHWELRDFTAKLVTSICKRFAHVYNNLQVRLTKTLLHAFLDPKRALTQHYGAIQGLAALGPNVVRLLIIPNMETYLRLLEPEMLLEKQKNEMKRHEAWRVFGALLHATGLSIYVQLKMFPSYPSPPPHAIWKQNARIMYSCPARERQANGDESVEQARAKNIVTDNADEMEIDKSTDALGDSVAGSSSSKVTPQDSATDARRRRVELRKPTGNSSTLLNQTWKDDLDSGRLLVLSFELFGESILPFIPTPEMFVFL